MEPERIFPSEYLPNAEGAAYHNKWKKASPLDAGRWEKFRNGVLVYKAGNALEVPTMATKYGRALVAAGRLHMSVIDLGAVWEEPEPPPPPPPPPPSRTFVRKSDMQAGYNLWSPVGWYDPATQSGTPWPSPGGWFEFTDPQYGPCLRYVASNIMYAPWDNTAKICQAGHYDQAWTANWEGQHQLWTGYIRFPTSLNPSGFNTSGWGHSVLMQWGTIWSGSTSVGHELMINHNGTMKFYLRQGPTSQPTVAYTTASAVPLGTWIPWEWEIKWSQGSDGMQRGSINGVQLMNLQGPTMWNNERVRHFGVGFYASNGAGILNGVEHAEMQMAVI